MTVRMLVNIDVDDVAKGAEFYTKALGLTVGRKFGHDAIELLGGGTDVTGTALEIDGGWAAGK